MSRSLALIIPAALKSHADLVSVALRHAPAGEETYSVARSASGNAPATHYGCHTRADEAFVAVIEAAIIGSPLPPAPWGAVGLKDDDVREVCGALLWRDRGLDEYGSNFNAALTEAGLQRIVERRS